MSSQVFLQHDRFGATLRFWDVFFADGRLKAQAGAVGLDGGGRKSQHIELFCLAGA